MSAPPAYIPCAPRTFWQSSAQSPINRPRPTSANPKCAWIAAFNTCTFTRDRVDTIVQGYLEHFRYIEVAREKKGLFAKGTYLDTTTAATFAGVLQGFALAQQFHDIDIGIENRGITVALTDHLAGGMQETIGGFTADMH